MPLWKSMDKLTFLSTMQQSNTLWRIFRIWPQNNWNTLSELTSSHNSTLHGQYWIFHIMKTRDFWSCMHAQLKPEISEVQISQHKNDHQKLQKGCLRASEAIPRKPDVEKLTGICSSLVEVICCCCYFLSFSDMHCHTWRKGVSS